MDETTLAMIGLAGFVALLAAFGLWRLFGQPRRRPHNPQVVKVVSKGKPSREG